MDYKYMVRKTPRITDIWSDRHQGLQIYSQTDAKDYKYTVRQTPRIINIQSGGHQGLQIYGQTDTKDYKYTVRQARITDKYRQVNLR